MERLFWQIVVGILGIYLGINFVPGVSVEIPPEGIIFLGIKLTAQWQVIVLIGIVLGLVNFFIKPIFKIVTLPLRILTFGLFGFIINMLMIWLVDIFFPELVIEGIIPLFWLTIVVWVLSFLLGLGSRKTREMILEE
jgi:putative membrane protein